MIPIECSMTRTGCCDENTVMERLFSPLKHKCTNHESFPSLEDTRMSVFCHIESIYNPRCLHLTFGYQSPDQLEAENALASAAQALSQLCPEVLNYRIRGSRSRRVTHFLAP